MSFRKIVVDGREWRYKVGKWNVVAIAQDNREKRLIDFVSLTGMEPQTIEKCIHKGGFSIYPSDIVRWLCGIIPARPNSSYKKPKSVEHDEKTPIVVK